MENKKTDHYYILPDKRIAQNMKEGCEMMDLGPQGFRALVKKGIVTKVATSETERYDNDRKTNQQIH